MACHAEVMWYSNFRCNSTVPDSQRSPGALSFLFPYEACDFMDSCLELCTLSLSLSLSLSPCKFGLINCSRKNECARMFNETEKVLFVVLCATPFLF
jgi:hypothetical protein